MDLSDLDIDWDFLLERIERIIDLGEESFERKLALYQPDPALFAGTIALRWLPGEEGGVFAPIAAPDIPDREELIGLDDTMEALCRNTAQFVAGLPANNVLLWGERGSGKSSAIKCLLAEFADSPLRMIEVGRDDLYNLPDISFYLREQPYRFILFCDDFCFDLEEGESYHLASLLEGSLDARPENVLIYATSNRIPQALETPAGDTWQTAPLPEGAQPEQLALCDRFGIILCFGPMTEKTYLATARHLAARMQLAIPEAELDRLAQQWAQRRVSRSGRVARQFVDDLAGRTALANPHPETKKA